MGAHEFELRSRALGSLASAPDVTQNAIMKVRDILRLLADNGWVLVRTRGSHQQFKHPSKSGLVTLAGSGNDDLAPGTLNSILKQAGLKDRDQE